MMIMKTLSLLTFSVVLIIMILTSILSKKPILDREKCSPFECGFDPKSSARMPFSLQFFLIAVIFLIFDIEITLLLPLIITMKITKIWSFSIISSIFIFILIMGLYHEWNQGALNWAL
uniref:NADH-ubiquinone oxidoreductase chain 3 n=1 Tax=Asymmetricata circumdata TaxID=1915122 RepID=A0A343A7J5_9COLE|nr:NADH dehydrogenase subunit 3 [Asymmetricata circumdata]APB92611.1 NADH dehydrogenase subunit 3 [Asymmetricata circumdata]